jgi:diacylglycerol kinase family enzyme
MSGIGIIVNPRGKKYKKDPDRLRRLSFIVGDRASYSATEDLHDLRRVAEEFKTRDIDILAIGGGDGTNHVTLSQFIEVYGEKPLPQLTFLRGGTMNTLANSVNIKGHSEEILSNLIYKYHEGKTFEITQLDLMKVNDKYGFIFGMGAIYRFMESYYRGMAPSPPKATWTLSRSIVSALLNGKFARGLFQRFDAEVIVDGEPWPFANWSALLAGSIPLLGLKFRVFHYAEEPGAFHAIGFSVPPRNVLKLVPYVFAGKKSSSDDWVEQPARDMRIRLSQPMPYIIDGDMLPAVPEIHLSTGPRLKIIVR